MSKKKIMDFQEATADRIAEIFGEGKQRRVLLADEVGLGKTIMAKAVIDRVRKLRQSVNDDMYRIVYVCSNQNIIKQNMNNLGINDVLDITDSRLSMQHLTLEERMHELKEKELYGDGKMPELLLPLTPGTSFNMTSSLGTMEERALLYSLIFKMKEFANETRLYSFFKSEYVKDCDKWKWYVNSYRNRIEKCGSDYIQKMHENFRKQKEFDKFKTDLLSQCHTAEPDMHTVNLCILSLRKMAALISIKQLEPDLVIMDEFQRFSSLLNTGDDNEQNMITQEFFGNTSSDEIQQPLILLLSATPYKPYTTLEELNENNCDSEYEDFVSLMNFLFKNNEEVKFAEVWHNYSHALSQLNTDNFSVLFAHKIDAENTLYKGMCRTERPNQNLITDNHKSLPISEGDILSYAHMQKVFDDCHRLSEEYPEKKFRFSSVNVPIDYVKSSPYLLSFMDQYELKKKITKIYQTLRQEGIQDKLPVSQIQQTYLLKEDYIYKYRKIALNNARLSLLEKEAFQNLGEQNNCHAERLLWLPASHPYYTTSASNVFERNKGFSKILVFSAWEMVPRMIASMLSYEAERLTIGEAIESATYTNSIGRPQLSDTRLLCYASQYLADTYKPENYYGQNITNIRKAIISVLRDKVMELYPTISIEGRECSERLVLRYAKAFDGETDNFEPTKISEKVFAILADLAIGSPAVCLLRILKDKEMAEKLSEQFRSLFNRRISGAILDLIYEHKSQDFYYEQVLDYCVMGNLQAVLDEFAFMINGNKEAFSKCMNESFVEMTSTLDVDTSKTFGLKAKKWPMRIHFALPFNQAKHDKKKMERSNNVRQAFNSPFRPFVLASTSVGQEGLDFHWYCRKIMHWNLPSNPQDLEQREGRINRFQCLAIRRNIANLYFQHFHWEDMFAAAAKDLHDKYPQYNDMVPFWCLPPEMIEEKRAELEMIERIVPNFPMSLDGERYKRLIEILSLYRLTMGQPRQEELLQLLDGKVNAEQIQQLLFDLSPYSHKHK